MEYGKKLVRIRLFFQDPGMLSKAQADQGLAKSWYLVDTGVSLSIGHLAARIAGDFRLGHLCPCGVSLEMCGFVLPPSQSTRLLQDSDLVSLRRKQEGDSAGQARELLTNSLSVDSEDISAGARIGGVELRALDEFEREAGGYESEYSGDEDADFLLGVENGLDTAENGQKVSKLTESTERNRKRPLNTDSQIDNIIVRSAPRSIKGAAGVDLVGSETAKKSNRKEKGKKIIHRDHGSSQNLALEFETLEEVHRSENVGGLDLSKSDKKKKKRREMMEKSEPKVNNGEDVQPRNADFQERRSGKKRKFKTVKETADLEQKNLKVLVDEKTPCQSIRVMASGLTGGFESRLLELTPEAGHKKRRHKQPKDTIVADHDQGKESSKDKRSKSGNKDAVEDVEQQPGAAKLRKQSQEGNGKDGKLLLSNVCNNEKVSEDTIVAEKGPSRSARRKKAKKRWLRENPLLSNVCNNEIVSEVAIIEEKRPSRSALRKKAKKRWLREQAKDGLLSKKEDFGEQPRKEAAVNESETSEDEEEEEEEAEEEAEEEEVDVEMEAEEEILPVMVAPGHFRFEPDEDVGDRSQNPLPVLRLSTEVRCKRQGQAWGQEKTHVKHHGNNYYSRSHEKMEENRLEEIAEPMPTGEIIADQTQFEKLPVLNCAPQVGDVLAYRLVELTASWTPELSAYRVGKVGNYNDTTKMAILMPVPEYPMRTQPQDVDMDAQQDDDLFLPPYNPDGTLEVDLPTLMEVRVVEKGPDDGLLAIQLKPVTSEVLDVSAMNADTLSNSLQLPVSSKKERAENVNSMFEVQEVQKTLMTEDTPQVGTGKEISAREAEAIATSVLLPVVDSACDTAWQDILSRELKKKKLELSANIDKLWPGCEGSSPVVNEAPASGGTKSLSNQEGHAELGKTQPRKNGEPQIRHRHMRTGALGPTMALLRASQVL